MWPKEAQSLGMLYGSQECLLLTCAGLKQDLPDRLCSNFVGTGHKENVVGNDLQRPQKLSKSSVHCLVTTANLADLHDHDIKLCWLGWVRILSHMSKHGHQRDLGCQP